MKMVSNGEGIYKGKALGTRKACWQQCWFPAVSAHNLKPCILLQNHTVPLLPPADVRE